MDTLSYKTEHLTKSTNSKEWVVVDAAGLPVGRVASEIAKILKGKTKASYTPHMDCGDRVIVINAEKVIFTGNKMTKKEYVRHTGNPGGQRFQTPSELMTKFPERIIETAVRGMLPKNRLGRKIFTSLYVYAGSEHPHQAQQPKEISFAWKK